MACSVQAEYESIGGNYYQYDLSDPAEQLDYDIDIDAQYRDMYSVDIQMDDKLDSNGGGIYDGANQYYYDNDYKE